MRTSLLSGLAVLLLGVGFSAQAATANIHAATPAVPAHKAGARCHDATGKFVACPKVIKRVACRDTKGKYIACRSVARRTTCRDNNGKFIACHA